MGYTLPGWALRLGQIAFTLGLLALIWRAADGAAAARSLLAAQWGWLALGVGALSLQTVLSALRWRLTARRLGIALRPGQAISEYYLSQIVNQSLPGGMVGDAGRAVRSRQEAGLMAAGQAVVLERLAGQAAMFCVLVTGVAVTWARPGGLDWPAWLLAPVAILIAGGLASPVLALAACRLPGAAGRAARRFRGLLHTALTCRAALPGQVALSVGTTICNLAAFAFCARAVGVELGAGALTALVPLILFTMLIPVSVSGWGLREGAAAALLPLAGASASDGLAASVAFGLSFLAAVLPGCIVLWSRPRRRPGTTAAGATGRSDASRRLVPDGQRPNL